MNSILFWLGALVLVTILSPVMRVLVAAVAGKQIGAAALAKQPDTIHLEPRNASAWKNAPAVNEIVVLLKSRGFADAGVYAVREMPGLVLQLLAQTSDNFYAAVYEHPQAGVWFDLVSKFQDGTSITFGTSRPTALKPRPGHATVNLPGMGAIQVLEKALADRPRKWPEQVSTDRAVQVFEKAYAESMAYRRQAGISTGEVVKTSLRKVA